MGTSYSPNIVRDGLILYVDAANPKSYPKIGTTVDSFMGGYSGDFVNDVTFSPSSLGNWEFDGVDDYIDFGQASGGGFTSALDPQLNSYTANVFFEIDNSNTATNAIIGKGCGSSNIIGWLIWYSEIDNALYLRCSGQNSTLQRAVRSYSIDKGRIYMATLVIDREQNKLFGYLNGENPTGGSTDITGFDSIISPNKFLLGIRHQINLGLKGNIYLAQIYNRALSSQEVKQNYNALKGRFGL